MGMPARAHALVTLVHIWVKAHADYGPRQEPKKDGVEFGNYNVNCHRLLCCIIPDQDTETCHLYKGLGGADGGTR
jgi:hypothetical protein